MCTGHSASIGVYHVSAWWSGLYIARWCASVARSLLRRTREWKQVAHDGALGGVRERLIVEGKAREAVVLRTDSGVRLQRLAIETPEVQLREALYTRQCDVCLTVSEDLAIEKDVNVARERRTLHTMDRHGMRRHEGDLQPCECAPGRIDRRLRTSNAQRRCVAGLIEQAHRDVHVRHLAHRCERAVDEASVVCASIDREQNQLVHTHRECSRQAAEAVVDGAAHLLARHYTAAGFAGVARLECFCGRRRRPRAHTRRVGIVQCIDLHAARRKHTWSSRHVCSPVCVCRRVVARAVPHPLRHCHLVTPSSARGAQHLHVLEGLALGTVVGAHSRFEQPPVAAG